MLALSVSISTISSPRWTSSPSDLSHRMIVPSSIESERRGIDTSDMAREGTGLEDREDRLRDLRLVRIGDLLERLGVGHRQVGPGAARDGRVEPVEGLLLDERREVRADAAVRPAL